MQLKPLLRKKSVQYVLQELEKSDRNSEHQLQKTLGVWDLTAFGVAAIIGAGIFSTIGNAAFYGGPAVIFLFILTAVACGFSALCYAEFASVLPVAGSAYTYAYTAFGELIAWMIGWDLLMEYAISNIAVAISWSEYFTAILTSYDIHLPPYLTTDGFSAYRNFQTIEPLTTDPTTSTHLTQLGFSSSAIRGFFAWTQAPRLFGIPLICNLPALLITGLVTWIAYFGIQESKLTSNFLVILKIAVILLVIGIGACYINPGNWVPFAPHGTQGIFRGVSAVFFAYIGFDAISTTAEECKNPQRDLPRGMMYSLILCTLLYVLMSLVLTGIVHHSRLDVGDPLAFVFGPEGAQLPWLSSLVSISAVIALFTVLLVYQIGQPRIWMAMSRDGLLPPLFSSIHPRFKTPWFSTLVTGLLVAIPSLFMNLKEVTDLTSTGTLFAFSLVCTGALFLVKTPHSHRKFKMPYWNSQYIFPLLVVTLGALLVYKNPQAIQAFFSIHKPFHERLQDLPFWLYLIEIICLMYCCFRHQLSLIPVLGLSTCTYLMTELGLSNWLRFGIWLLLGFTVYFLYGMRKSKLKAASVP